jgi:hypothetical protein
MRLRLPGQLCTLLALATFAVQPAAAQRRLLVNTNAAGMYVYGGLHYGGDQWSRMTAAIDDTFTGGVTTIATMTNLSQMLEYDALWVDQRWQATATKLEIDNMLAFAATGRRVVVMGENATWGGWNSQVLKALGGMEGPAGGFDGGAGCMYGRVMGLGTHALTSGVNGINLACGGYAIGGTQLFAYNVATLWGAQQNVLTILDGNVMDDMFAAYEAPLFRTRVVSWLSESVRPTTPVVAAQVQLRAAKSSIAFDDEQSPELAALRGPVGVLATPEPSTIALLAIGVGALAAARRRVRTA